MTKKHSYTNPEDKFDAAYVEAQGESGRIKYTVTLPSEIS